MFLIYIIQYNSFRMILYTNVILELLISYNYIQLYTTHIYIRSTLIYNIYDQIIVFYMYYVHVHNYVILSSFV